ncbi:MAG: nickel/cobalt efflux transporter RcnA [Rhodospirillales bacterium]|nr:nickel/cobalt efflux transporter RcnA [Rhodospirillales bacterium]
MTPFADLLQQGTTPAWLFLPTAVLLGALHGLEPGHSKTMMAAFIIAVRGTIPQAILLGLSAMVSHTIVIWVLAAAALSWGDSLIGEDNEPIFMVASGVIVIGVACWMLWQTWRRSPPSPASEHHHHHHHHHHQDERHHHDNGHAHDHHHDHAHDDVEANDAHARFHAQQIRQRFQDSSVTTAQVAVFGLTGGLLPCSAAIVVLLACLHVNQFALGMAMVGAFSLGLATVLVAVGVLAAWGTRQATKRFEGFSARVDKFPYLSGAVVLVIGALMLMSGWSHLSEVTPPR